MGSDHPGMCTSQLIRPINALDELCRLMKSFVHPKPGAAGSLGTGLIPISSELCYRLGACQIAMCRTGMQRCAESQGAGGRGREGLGGPLGRVGPQEARLEACFESWFFGRLLSPDKATAHSWPQFAHCEMGLQGKVVLGELLNFPAP